MTFNGTLDEVNGVAHMCRTKARTIHASGSPAHVQKRYDQLQLSSEVPVARIYMCICVQREQPYFLYVTLCAILPVCDTVCHTSCM